MGNELYQILIGLPVAATAGYLCGDAAHAFNISEHNNGLVIGLRYHIMAGYGQGTLDSRLPRLTDSLVEEVQNQYQKISVRIKLRGEISDTDKYLHAVYVFSTREVMEMMPIGPISWISKKLTLKKLRKKQRDLELRLRLIQAN